MQMNEIREKTLKEIEKIYSLPAKSSIMLEVTKLLDNPDATNADLSKLIGKDQGISSKVLSIANSPLYGLPRKVSTIDFAIMIIGFHDVKNIVVALSMIEAFKEKESKELHQNNFWIHSLMTGNAAKKLSEDLGFKISGEVFIAGLLHDLGIVVLYRYFKKQFNELVKLAEENKKSISEYEVDLLGFTHSEVGNMLAEKWNLPTALCDAIKYHHQPSLAPANQVVIAIIHLVDYILQKFQIGSYFWDSGINLDEKVLDILNFSNIDELDTFIKGYQSLFEEEIKMLRI